MRDGATVEFSKQLDRLCDVLENRPSIPTTKDQGSCIIVGVMDIVWEGKLRLVRLMGFMLISPIYGYSLYVVLSSD